MLKRSRVEGREAAGPETGAADISSKQLEASSTGCGQPFIWCERPLSLPETARISEVSQDLLNGSGLDRLVGPDGLAGRHGGLAVAFERPGGGLHLVHYCHGAHRDLEREEQARA